MKREGLVIAFVCSTFFLNAQSLATPEAQVWHREKLLGANDSEFFYLRTERDNPGSHHEFTERIKICRKPKNKPEGMKEEVIRETRYVDTSASGGVWIAKGKSHQTFDLSSYLLENHVVMALPALGYPSLVIDTGGVFFQDGTVRERVLSTSEYLSQIPELAYHLHAGASFGAQRVTGVEVVELQNWSMPDYYYFTVMSVNDGWYEDLLVISAERVKKAVEAVRRARNPR